ncbi:Hypothetical predicted protein [Paramuricea clavata]|uniref:Uncharacterized protein n=1 Tax=Paramuricea clavata TaxID=317549 RepID=A0A6S7JKU1_PARCT|nr:Hypothetical predicted protein [Paramuricea clavata]
MDKWENDLSNDVYSIEEESELYFSTISLPAASQTSQIQSTSQNKQSIQTPTEPEIEPETIPVSSIENNPANKISEAPQVSPISVESGQNTINTNLSSPTTPCPFDAWLDDLVEFKETVLPKSSQSVSVADPLYKLEASKDIPTIKLPKFSGNALFYADFIDRFKIHIHDKPHLTDDMRMIQLKMHVTGDAERAISGLGSKGVMYATALKIFKEQFGQPSTIARSLVNQLTKGDMIQRNDRRALRELSIDLVNCVATMHQVKYFADVNASDNLRKIVMRLPDYLIPKWKGVVIDIREKQRSPTIEDISTFLGK